MKGAILALLVLALPVPAAGLTLDGPLTQGGLVVGRAPPGTRVTLDGAPVRVSQDGLFLLGFGRDAPARAELSLTGPDGRTETRDLKVAAREYPVQRIEGLPEKKVSPPPEDLERIRRESAQVAEARKADTARPFFGDGFVWPADGVVSGVFGSQRILNGKPRAPHNGVDIAASTGTPVRAMGAGIVRLAHPDMLLTGRTLMIDHGHGLTSVYLHLEDIRVAEGREVAKGTVIGSVGKSGRATGPHLHWGVNLFATALDPVLVVAEPKP
ncbi:MAG: M23 family metallopeptidase [Magnetospirillum sp. WYHS-4]